MNDIIDDKTQPDNCSNPNTLKQDDVTQKAEKAFAKNYAEREKFQAQRKDILNAIGRGVFIMALERLEENR